MKKIVAFALLFCSSTTWLAPSARADQATTPTYATPQPHALLNDSFASLDAAKWNSTGVVGQQQVFPNAQGGCSSSLVGAGIASGGALTIGVKASNTLDCSVVQSTQFFGITAPGWLWTQAQVTLPNPLIAHARFFWGFAVLKSGVSPGGSPAAEFTNALGFETSETDQKMRAVVWNAGTETTVADLSAATGNGKQPTDGLPHTYFIQYRSTSAYFYIDNLASPVAQISNVTTFPAAQTMPVTYMAYADATGTAANTSFSVGGMSVGDTSGVPVAVSDPAYPWRQATVSQASSLPSSTQNVTTQSAAGTSPLTYTTTSGPGALFTSPTNIGTYICLQASGSYTPVVESDTVAPTPVLEYVVPSGKSLVVTRAYFVTLAAGAMYARLLRRYLLYGHNATATPTAPTTPTAAISAGQNGPPNGSIQYKIQSRDCFGGLGTLSAASAAITASVGNHKATVTLAALQAGACSYAIYRSQAAGTFFYVGDTASTSWVDSGNTSTTAAPAGTSWSSDVPASGVITPMATAGEGVFEVFSALGAAPAAAYYTNEKGVLAEVAFAPATTAGTRVRIKLANEARNLVTTSTIGTTLAQGQVVSDYGYNAPVGAGTFGFFDSAPSTIGGEFAVWGHEILGVGETPTAAAAGGVVPINLPASVIFPSGAELIVDAAATATGAAGVRRFVVEGYLYP